MSTIVLMSLWCNDVQKNLEQRARHLLAKSPPAPIFDSGDGGSAYAFDLRWVWVVGDSQDDTEAQLHEIARQYAQLDIEIVHHDTGIWGEDPHTRLRRLSQTTNAGLERVRPDDVYWIIHESDLQSPPTLVELFLAMGECPVAGWVTLGTMFYDTFAYRKDGVMFSNHAPYHACYRADGLFEVDSVGSCWMFHAEDVRDGVRCGEWAVLDLCRQLKERGRRFWVDPRIPIVQPVELWVSRGHAT